MLPELNVYERGLFPVSMQNPYSGGLGIFVKDNILSYIDLIEIDFEYLMLIQISS